MCINYIIIDIGEFNRFIIFANKIRLLFLNLTEVSKNISFSYEHADFPTKRDYLCIFFAYNESDSY